MSKSRDFLAVLSVVAVNRTPADGQMDAIKTMFLRYVDDARTIGAGGHDQSAAARSEVLELRNRLAAEINHRHLGHLGELIEYALGLADDWLKTNKQPATQESDSPSPPAQ